MRLLYPAVEQGGQATDTMIHSKVMVVDDRFLRVGSANMNNRSMGADTECDLAIEAHTDRERTAILEIRNRLLGEHCGVAADDVAAFLAQHGSLVRAADELSANGHSLRPIDDGEPDEGGLSHVIERIADPPRPIRPARLARHLLARLRPLLIALVCALVLLGIALAWRYTPLSGLVTADNVRGGPEGRARRALGDRGRGPGVRARGRHRLPAQHPDPDDRRGVRAVARHPLWRRRRGEQRSCHVPDRQQARSRGALSQCWASAGGTASRALRKRGLLAVVTFRLLPIAPFTLVNLAAGASGIRFVDFLVGTLIGMLPGLVLLSIMGDRIIRILAEPSAGDIAILVLCVAALIGLAVAAQAFLSRRGGRA